MISLLKAIHQPWITDYIILTALRPQDVIILSFVLICILELVDPRWSSSLSCQILW